MISHSPEQTSVFAERFARRLKKGDIVCLFGELGSGKTTFVQGLAKGLKVKPSTVHSPTFTLMNVYEGRLTMYHFDLYRIEGKELPAIGYEEFFYGGGVAVIEWAERLGSQMPKKYIKVELEHKGETQRLMRISNVGKKERE